MVDTKVVVIVDLTAHGRTERRRRRAPPQALAAGELVILPTETVYGLAADAANAEAVARLYEAKGRPRFNPLIAHVADLAAARRVARFDERGAAPGRGVLARAADHRGPGRRSGGGLRPRPRRARHRGRARAGASGRAGGAAPVRPADRRAVGQPLRPAQPDHPRRRGRRDRRAAAVALDGGPCAIGLESTVVALLDGPPRLLRPGAVTRARDRGRDRPARRGGGRRARSPGRLPATMRLGRRCG